MSRQPRIVVAKYPHHVVLRGNNRGDIFGDDNDKDFFMHCLEVAKQKAAVKLYSYCLMNNHVHLLIEPSEQRSLGKFMQSLGGKYVQYFNKKYKRSGTLWEGRYRSSVVSRDDYLLACSRYIELNPVRAGIVQSPAQYRWSSFSCRGEGIACTLIDYDPAYLGLASTPQERQEHYKRMFGVMFSDCELNTIRIALQKGRAFCVEESTDQEFSLRSSKKRGRPKK